MKEPPTASVELSRPPRINSSTFANPHRRQSARRPRAGRPLHKSRQYLPTAFRATDPTDGVGGAAKPNLLTPPQRKQSHRRSRWFLHTLPNTHSHPL